MVFSVLLIWLLVFGALDLIQILSCFVGVVWAFLYNSFSCCWFCVMFCVSVGCGWFLCGFCCLGDCVVAALVEYCDSGALSCRCDVC